MLLMLKFRDNFLTMSLILETGMLISSLIVDDLNLFFPSASIILKNPVLCIVRGNTVDTKPKTQTKQLIVCGQIITCSFAE